MPSEFVGINCSKEALKASEYLPPVSGALALGVTGSRSGNGKGSAERRMRRKHNM